MAAPEPVATPRPGAAAAPAVVVVGSLNLDLVVPVPHHPAAGETVLGGDHARHPGGKGANQAVAAARLGQAVAMVGRVGDDDAGRQLTAALADAGVDTRHVNVDPDAPTGLALIDVDPSGENAIVVSPGANARVGTVDLDPAAEGLSGAAVTLLQLEIPLDTVRAAANRARGTVLLNPAPAHPLADDLLVEVDVLVPNRSELALLAGAAEAPRDHDEVARLARGLAGPETVVVTLGSDGALVIDGRTVRHITARPVRPVDTTAAGDAFCGALADALVRRQPLGAAVDWATRAAAVTVTRHGAQPALPSRDEVHAQP